MNQQEPSTETGGLGERRRRREAERAARLAAEQAGKARPLTRRELRHRQLEEQARLEAIATGELPLVDGEGRPLPPEAAARMAQATRPPAPRAADRTTVAAQPSAPSAGDRPASPSPTAEPGQAGERPVAPAVLSRRSMRDRVRTDAAVPEDGPAERTTTTRRPVVRAPHAAKGIRSLDSTGTLTGVRPVASPATRTPAPAPDEPPVTTDPAGWESAAGLPAVGSDSTIVIEAVPAPGERGGTPAPAATTPAATAPAAPTPAAPTPAAPTPAATTPPAPTPAAPAAAATPAPAPAPPAPAASGPDPVGGRNGDRPTGPAFAPVRREPTAAERARSAASAASGPEAVAAAALGDDDDYDEEEARPQWASLAEFSAVSSASPEEATDPAGRAGGEPARRSLRDRMASPADPGPDEEDAEEEVRNPAASLVKIIALVLVAVVIGLLIGLLAFNQGDDGASVRIQSLTAAASVLPAPTP